MNAIRLHAFGPPENLVNERVEDPAPGPGQVRIAVAAAGVHLIDTTLRAGQQTGYLPLPDLPTIPGREVAGTVDALGYGVDEAWRGRRVVAHLGPASGGYAELAVRDVDAVHALPEGLGEDAAVAMIGTGRTTMAILGEARIAPDDVVLVTAAAGGIGTLLVQAARRAGATVLGVAGGPEKTERVRALGAIAVDYRQPDWPHEVRAHGREITLALDGVGGEPGRVALELLAPGGRLVMFGSSSGEMTQLSAGDLYARGITVSAAVGARVRTLDVRELETQALAAAANGEWSPALSRFPLAEAAAAHAALESRGTVGKVVLVP
jgi:NADPH:quinone reductase